MVPCVVDLYQQLPNETQHKAVYLLFCEFTLHVSVSTPPIFRSKQNCNYSLRYSSYFCAATSLQRGQLGHAGGR